MHSSVFVEQPVEPRVVSLISNLVVGLLPMCLASAAACH